MKLNLLKVGQWAGAITAIAILLAGIDGRYQTTGSAEAAELKTQQQYTELASDREEGDVDNQVEIIMVELKYLHAKEVKSSDDLLRIEMLSKKLGILMARQAELQK